jgi:hypothetical protein
MITLPRRQGPSSSEREGESVRIGLDANCSHHEPIVARDRAYHAHAHRDVTLWLVRPEDVDVFCRRQVERPIGEGNLLDPRKFVPIPPSAELLQEHRDDPAALLCPDGDLSLDVV